VSGVLGTVTSQITSAIADHGAYAIFAIMALDAVLPLGGELTMLFAGVLAAGAAGAGVAVFGAHVPFGIDSYVLLVVAGTLGSVVGSLVAYAVGAWGRGALVRPEQFDRAQMWLDGHGRSALFLGRLTPVVRSFISIPAGVLRVGLGVFTLSTLLASLLWCCAFAGAGWAVAASWQRVDHGFRYADYAGVLAVVALIGAAVIQSRRASRVKPGA
jgi:membrane protein DedA with SNARE-associated domain